MGRPAPIKPSLRTATATTSAARRRMRWRSGQKPSDSTASGDNNKSVFTKRWLLESDKERKPFAEELFTTTFSPENIKKLVTACKLATENEVNESNRLLTDDYVYSLQMTSHRAPHVPVHSTRIKLPHSIEPADAEICLFVKDLKRGRRLDFEPTIKYYEQLLKQKKVDRNITIIPINQLYNDFATFELRRKLTYLYDKFLVDKVIGSHVNGFLGPKLLMKCRSAVPIDLASDNLPEQIELGMRKVFYKHINNGVTQSIQVGRHSMSIDHISENIIDLVRQLGTLHPGGSQNIYKIYLKPNVNISVAVPIYINLDKPANLHEKQSPSEKPKVETDNNEQEEKPFNENEDVLEKVRRQGSSVVATDVVDDDNEDMPTPTVPSPKKDVGKLVTSKADEAALNELIMKNLKKLVGPNSVSSFSKMSGSGNSGTANKTINKNKSAPPRRRPVQQLMGSRSIGGGNFGGNNSSGSGFGGNNFGGGRNMNDFGRGSGGGSMDFGRNFGSGNDFGRNMGNMNSGGFGGNSSGNFGSGFGNSGNFGSNSGGGGGGGGGSGGNWNNSASYNDRFSRF